MNYFTTIYEVTEVEWPGDMGCKPRTVAFFYHEEDADKLKAQVLDGSVTEHSIYRSYEEYGSKYEDDKIRRRALSKLDPEERKVLGL
jgi:hypothetical protein